MKPLREVFQLLTFFINDLLLPFQMFLLNDNLLFIGLIIAFDLVYPPAFKQNGIVGDIIQEDLVV